MESFVSSLAVSFKYLDSLKKIHATTFFIPQITQGETEKVSNIKSAFSNLLKLIRAKPATDGSETGHEGKL